MLMSSASSLFFILLCYLFLKLEKAKDVIIDGKKELFKWETIAYTMERKSTELEGELKINKSQLDFICERNIILESEAGNITGKFVTGSQILTNENNKKLWNEFLIKLNESKEVTNEI